MECFELYRCFWYYSSILVHSGNTIRGNLSRVVTVVVCLSIGLLTLAQDRVFVCILVVKQRLLIHCLLKFCSTNVWKAHTIPLK